MTLQRLEVVSLAAEASPHLKKVLHHLYLTEDTRLHLWSQGELRSATTYLELYSPSLWAEVGRHVDSKAVWQGTIAVKCLLMSTDIFLRIEGDRATEPKALCKP